MRYAVIQDGKVVNIVEATPLFAQSQGWVDAKSAQIGDLWDGQVFTPSPTAPSVYAETVRTERNAKLAASDWTQLSDAPVDKTAWATYRQALRDITVQDGFPLTVTWPAEP